MLMLVWESCLRSTPWAGARNLMASSASDPWACICVGERAEFVRRYVELFGAHLDRKKEESKQRFYVYNRRGRREQSPSVTGVSSSRA